MVTRSFDLGVIWKGLISWEYMPNMNLYLLQMYSKYESLSLTDQNTLQAKFKKFFCNRVTDRQEKKRDF